jgi:ABC-type multidrug transport system fused ATPase/permease subunit
VALSFLLWAGQWLEILQLSYASQGILLRMRKELFEHLHRLPMSFFDRNKTGKLMSRVQNDVDQVQTLVTQDIISIVANVITLLAIAGVMLSMDWRLALITLTVVPVLALAIAIWQGYARRAFIRVRQAIAVVNDQLQEDISGIRVTQGMSREGQNLRQFNAVNKAHLDANVEAARLQAFMMPTVEILTNGAFALVLVFGGFQVMQGALGVGVLLAFLLYIQRFFAPVMEIVMMYTEIQRAMASGARIFELMDVVPDIQDKPQAIPIPAVKGEVKFDHVSFSYTPGEEILHDIDLTIRPGETVAIAGRTGAGKSSLTSLIARFYEASKGKVLIDGLRVDAVTQNSLRSQIGIVPQDPFLFSRTIEENIRYARMDATIDEIIEAAKAAGAHDFIMRLEHGYGTMVGERGGLLSAGQRQLICLARAILCNPPILILDEATSSVDTNTERIMQQSLKRISQGRTCVIIAHRLSTVTNADRIVVLEHGKIMETGNHQELMAKKGLYYQMFETLSAPGLEEQKVK